MIVPTLKCPADARQATTLSGTQAGIEPNSKVAFTGYLGLSGIQTGAPGSAAPNNTGILYSTSKTKMTDITDGTSNTLLVGERPPSSDLQFGWWFAGAGYNGWVTATWFWARWTSRWRPRSAVRRARSASNPGGPKSSATRCTSGASTTAAPISFWATARCGS